MHVDGRPERTTRRFRGVGATQCLTLLAAVDPVPQVVVVEDRRRTSKATADSKQAIRVIEVPIPGEVGCKRYLDSVKMSALVEKEEKRAIRVVTSKTVQERSNVFATRDPTACPVKVSLWAHARNGRCAYVRFLDRIFDVNVRQCHESPPCVVETVNVCRRS